MGTAVSRQCRPAVWRADRQPGRQAEANSRSDISAYRTNTTRLEGETMGFLLSTLDDVFGNSVVAQEFEPEKFADLIRSTTALTKGELPLYVGARLGTLRTPIGPNGKGGNSLRHD